MKEIELREKIEKEKQKSEFLLDQVKKLRDTIY